MSIPAAISSYLDRFTLHRVTLYALLGLILWALALSLVEVLHYAPLDIAGAAALATVVAVSVNYAFARVLRATTDVQSTLITALILALIIPIGLRDHAVFLIAASAVAAASKYVVTVDKQHLFNPAALALVALVLLFPDLTASWWVGTTAMLPAVIISGGLLMLKARRTSLALAFLATYAVATSMGEVIDSRSLAALPEVWSLALGQTALLFFVFFMVTDPLTVPSGKLTKSAYIAFVAFLYATPEIRFLPVGLTPEQALCIGNAVSFVIRPKYRLDLCLKRKTKVGADTWVFQFGLPPGVQFKPGQFMVWTVPHARPDGRGQRRRFTIASSPTEDDLNVVMRVPNPSSSYKRALVVAEEGAPVVATHLAGDFVLPSDLSAPLAFIAGGVGIAPFRSMAKYLVDKGIRCDIILLYACRRPDEILFWDIFDQAARLGLQTVYVLTATQNAPQDWKGGLGRISTELIQAEIPDYPERSFYLSGSQRMVQAMETALKGLHVHRSRIRTDYFDGSVEA